MEPRSSVQKTRQPRDQAAQIGKTTKRENGIFIENDITYIPGSKSDKKRKKKQNKAKIWGVQTSEEGAGGEEGERASAGVFGSPE